MEFNLKKVGAIGILLTMVSGLAMEIRSQVANNAFDIVRLKERERSTKDILIEIKDDIKYIKRRMDRRKK